MFHSSFFHSLFFVRENETIDTIDAIDDSRL